jgi:hypothetical protein
MWNSTPDYICQNCGPRFAARRSTARFCGPTCRKAASRGERGQSLAVRRAVTALQKAAGASVATAGTPTPTPAPNTNFVTLSTAPPGIVPDTRYPGMFRVIRPDGSLSDLANLTRARDALHAQIEREAAKRRAAA